MENELCTVPPDQTEVERRKRLEQWLDKGLGNCVLKDPKVASQVVESWKFFDNSHYSLVAWVVMPNHVHLLIHHREGEELGKIVQSWKRYTSRRINEWIRQGTVRDTHGKAIQQPSNGALWGRDYWDRFIRDEKHYENVVNYIHQNPVKAGLCRQPAEWAFSSARLWEEKLCEVGCENIPEKEDYNGTFSRADAEIGVPRKE
ncbi:MAG: transposase [Candidatus Sumerlaeia bacterium]|nr:transposase [Candidatus Sumerlaeia bacterium]